MRRHADAAQRVAQIVAENRQKHPPGLIDAMRVAADGLGKGLVDGLVEACDVLKVVQIRSGHTIAPESKNAGTKRRYSETTSLRLNPEPTRPTP